jgi:hypothetical protein
MDSVLSDEAILGATRKTRDHSPQTDPCYRGNRLRDCLLSREMSCAHLAWMETNIHGIFRILRCVAMWTERVRSWVSQTIFVTFKDGEDSNRLAFVDPSLPPPALCLNAGLRASTACRRASPACRRASLAFNKEYFRQTCAGQNVYPLLYGKIT